MKTENLLLVAAVGLGAYLILKGQNKTQETGNNPSVIPFYPKENILPSKPNEPIKPNQIPKNNNGIKGVDMNNYVTDIKTTGTAYNQDVITVTTSKGNSSTIIPKANTYYSNLGIGFDANKQGYSSISAILPAAQKTMTTTKSNVFNTSAYK